MAATDGDCDELPTAIFAEPDGFFREPESGKRVAYQRSCGRAPDSISLGLASKHSLHGHELWNAARYVASRLDDGSLPCRDCCVAELGAGAGLPSLIAACNGASCVLATDYGTAADDELIGVLRTNAAELGRLCPDACPVQTAAHVWGTDTAPLLAALPAGRAGFDILFACDLLFARAAHAALLHTIERLLSPTGVCWVTFSHHDPAKAPLDLAFFDLARAPPFHFDVERHVSRQYERDIFMMNDGLDGERATVHVYTLRRRSLDTRAPA